MSNRSKSVCVCVCTSWMIYKENTGLHRDSHQPGSSSADRQVGLRRNPRDMEGAPTPIPRGLLAAGSRESLSLCISFSSFCLTRMTPVLPSPQCCPEDWMKLWEAVHQWMPAQAHSYFMPAIPWQDTQALCASVSSSVKWGECVQLVGLVCGENELIYEQCLELCLPHSQGHWNVDQWYCKLIL